MLCSDEVQVGQHIHITVMHGKRKEIKSATVKGVYPRFAVIEIDGTGIRDTVALVPREKVP